MSTEQILFPLDLNNNGQAIEDRGIIIDPQQGFVVSRIGASLSLYFMDGAGKNVKVWYKL